MTGLLLIGVAIIWVWFSWFISRWAVRSIKSRGLKTLIGVAIFAVLLIAPLGDEIVGKHQFEALCRQYAVQEIDEEHAVNSRVISMPREKQQFAKGIAINVRIDPWEYRDESTNKVVVRYHTLHAEGGWLIRMLGISETNAPLLFSSYCGPASARAFIKKFNVTIIN